MWPRPSRWVIVDVPADDDEHAAAEVAGLEQRFAIAVAAGRAEPLQPLDFLRRQRREHLIVAQPQGR